MEVLYVRCAGLDVHKDSVVAGVRVVEPKGAGPVHVMILNFAAPSVRVAKSEKTTQKNNM
ncbi:MAG: hypothetical protein HC900_08355 [Methylacidiphilales bacterium]|nr:hypothetical protein [Candidatus Methylacidiphilales bacterium]